MVAPVATITGLFAASTYVALVDPNQPGHYPLCPLKYVTGWDCPGCGGLRATHDLLHGDVVRAADHNLMVVVMIPVVVAFLILWLVRSWTGRPEIGSAFLKRWGRPLGIAAAIAVVLFTVLRNVPGVPFLDSGLTGI